MNTYLTRKDQKVMLCQDFQLLNMYMILVYFKTKLTNLIKNWVFGTQLPLEFVLAGLGIPNGYGVKCWY